MTALSPQTRLTRRQVMAGLLAASGMVADAEQASARAETPPGFTVPEPACDSHQHVIGPMARYPMAADRGYTPPPAPLAALDAMHAALGIRRTVLVQPSFYGTDNSCLLDALATLGASARGIVVLPDDIPPAAIVRMKRLGAVGLRVNQTHAVHDAGQLRSAVRSAMARAAPLGWQVQLYLKLPSLDAIADILATSPVPIVLDHFGGASAQGPEQPGFRTLCRLVADGHCHVKLSAPYRATASAEGEAAMVILARHLIDAGEDRILWGSDWPHTRSLSPGTPREGADTGFFDVDDGRLLNDLLSWMTPVQRRRALVDNPARLFGFM